VRAPIDSSTGAIGGQEIRGLLEFAGSDVCDTFQAFQEYLYVLCTYTENLRLNGGSPLLSIWEKTTFAYVSGI